MNRNCEYRAIISYLYLKDLRGKQIYKDMLHSPVEQCPLHAMVKNWITSFRRERSSIKDKVDREGQFL